VQRAGEVVVPGVPVADDGAGVAWQHAAGVDVVGGAAAGVQGGEELGAGHVHVVQLAGGAGWGLVGSANVCLLRAVRAGRRPCVSNGRL
jgi:hypothetical protein